MQRFLLVTLFLLPSLLAQAQRDSLHSHSIGVSYFSQGGFYPGFTLNYEKKLLASNSMQLLLAGKVGAYFHVKNNTGLFLMIQSGQRFRLGEHLFFEHFLGVGYLQTFLSGGEAYYVNAAGQIQKAGNIGSPHFMPSVSLGLSYHMNGKHKAMVFARPMIYWQIPFNEIALVQYAFEVGTLWSIGR